MAKPKQKSAKDLAFDKERAQFRVEIRELQSQLADAKKRVWDMEKEITDLQRQLEEKDDWIRRLLEYTDMDEKDMKKKILQEKITGEVFDSMWEMRKIFGGYGGY